MKRKYIGFLMLAAVLVLSLCLLPAQAEAAIVDSGTCGDNLTWTLDDAGNLSILGTGKMTDYYWNESFGPWGTEIKTVTIQHGVTSIGDDAFRGCSNLTSVSIPDSVTSIGMHAFNSCSSLITITIPNGVTRISDSTFCGCSRLASIILPNSITSIGINAFAGCDRLSSITIPSSVATIEDFAFCGCFSLKEIRFQGDAPNFFYAAFFDLTTTAYYPARNLTWTVDVMQDYTGNITWVSYMPPMDNVVINQVIAHKTGNILYWNAVDGADIYQIYRLNGSNWELLKNTRSLGYKDETAKVGVKHYYKIVARNGDAKSDIKTTVSASAIRPDTKLGNVTIYKTIGHSTGNILYWNAVDGAKLYQVYRLNGTTWELLKNTGSLGYKDETAPKGVACYYKIVARDGDIKSDIKTTTSTRVVRAK